MKTREQVMNVFVLTDNVVGLETEVKGVFAHEALAMLAADEKTSDFRQVLDLPGERKWTAPTPGRGNRVGWYEITEHEVRS
jgi:hypothetical protein